jgi:SAM-dependent methyltransferase
VNLTRHRREWESLADLDPLWAVLTDSSKRGGRWDVGQFLDTGEQEIAEVVGVLDGLGLPRRRSRALDFGCGAGRLTRALGTRFDAAIGVDIAAPMVELARRINADVSRCTFEVNTEAHLRRFADCSFDLVYTSLVLQHLPGRQLIGEYLVELLRVTAPGGALVFGVPDRIAWPYRLGLRRRGFVLMRAFGVPQETLLRRTRLSPMRMTVASESWVRPRLVGAGGCVRLVEELDQGPVRTKRYVVEPAPSAS